MVAHGTNLGSLLADDNMAAVAALPDHITLTREDHSILDVLQQLAIAFLVMFLDGAYEFKLRIKEPSRDSHFIKDFLFSFFLFNWLFFCLYNRIIGFFYYRLQFFKVKFGRGHSTSTITRIAYIPPYRAFIFAVQII